MKLISTFLIVLFTTATAEGQLQLGYHYIIKKCIPVNYIYSDTEIVGKKKIITIYKHQVDYLKFVNSDSTNGDIQTKVAYLPPMQICPKKGLKANLKQDDSGRIVITFWGITSEKNCWGITDINMSRKVGLFYYKIFQPYKLSDVFQPTRVPYRTWEIGVATVPFKYRFSRRYNDTVRIPNDASLNFNAGIYFGRKWGHTVFYSDKNNATNTNYFSIVSFITPMIIPISSDNTKPTTDSIQKKALLKKPNELGLSTGIGVLFGSKNLNVGLLVGIDMDVSGLSHIWYYRRRPWIGFGIGYKLSIFGEK